MHNIMELKGQIYKVGESQQVTEKLRKREVIVKTEASSQYPQHIKVQFSQDKCELADTLRIGQDVTFQCNLRGKLYTDKNGVENCITNLEVWKVEAGEAPNVFEAMGLPKTNIDDIGF